MIPQTSQLSHLKIAFWNADNLRTKLAELEEFALRHNIDIITVNETQLTSGYSANLPNYISYRADRLHAEGGGTAQLFILKDL